MGLNSFSFRFLLVYYFVFLSYLLLFCSVRFLLSSPPDFDLLEPIQAYPIITFFLYLPHTHIFQGPLLSFTHFIRPRPDHRITSLTLFLALALTLTLALALPSALDRSWASGRGFHWIIWIRQRRQRQRQRRRRWWCKLSKP